MISLSPHTALAGALFIALTVAVYWVLRRVYARVHFVLLNPIFSSVVVLIFLLVVFHISYNAYMTGGVWLRDLLQPATVAFAIPLHRHFRLLLENAWSVAAGVVTGCLVAVTSTALIGRGFGLPDVIVRSLAPRSITTPVAMEASRMVHGLPVLTAAFVIVTAFCGLLVGPWVIRLLRIRTPIAKGLMYGAGAHGIGTSRAFELGDAEGSASSLAMVLSAVLTVLVVPWFVPWLLQI
ncbi:MAG: LrgB family protein [Alicyclobacillus sp.]|nr:LrgB family protein [Alicyclobacillus sp.]